MARTATLDMDYSSLNSGVLTSLGDRVSSAYSAITSLPGRVVDYAITDEVHAMLDRKGVVSIDQYVASVQGTSPTEKRSLLRSVANALPVIGLYNLAVDRTAVHNAFTDAVNYAYSGGEQEPKDLDRSTLDGYMAQHGVRNMAGRATLSKMLDMADIHVTNYGAQNKSLSDRAMLALGTGEARALFSVMVGYGLAGSIAAMGAKGAGLYAAFTGTTVAQEHANTNNFVGSGGLSSLLITGLGVAGMAASYAAANPLYLARSVASVTSGAARLVQTAAPKSNGIRIAAKYLTLGSLALSVPLLLGATPVHAQAVEPSPEAAATAAPAASPSPASSAYVAPAAEPSVTSAPAVTATPSPLEAAAATQPYSPAVAPAPAEPAPAVAPASPAASPLEAAATAAPAASPSPASSAYVAPAAPDLATAVSSAAVAPAALADAPASTVEPAVPTPYKHFDSGVNLRVADSHTLDIKLDQPLLDRLTQPNGGVYLHDNFDGVGGKESYWVCANQFDSEGHATVDLSTLTKNGNPIVLSDDYSLQDSDTSLRLKFGFRDPSKGFLMRGDNVITTINETDYTTSTAAAPAVGAAAPTIATTDLSKTLNLYVDPKNPDTVFVRLAPSVVDQLQSLETRTDLQSGIYVGQEGQRLWIDFDTLKNGTGQFTFEGHNLVDPTKEWYAVMGVRDLALACDNINSPVASTTSDLYFKLHPLSVPASVVAEPAPAVVPVAPAVEPAPALPAASEPASSAYVAPAVEPVPTVVPVAPVVAEPTPTPAPESLSELIDRVSKIDSDKAAVMVGIHNYNGEHVVANMLGPVEMKWTYHGIHTEPYVNPFDANTFASPDGNKLFFDLSQTAANSSGFTPISTTGLSTPEFITLAHTLTDLGYTSSHFDISLNAPALKLDLPDATVFSQSAEWHPIGDIGNFDPGWTDFVNDRLAAVKAHQDALPTTDTDYADKNDMLDAIRRGLLALRPTEGQYGLIDPKIH